MTFLYFLRGLFRAIAKDIRWAIDDLVELGRKS